MLIGPEGVGKTALALAVADSALSADTWPGGLAAHPDVWVEDSDAERIPLARVRYRGRGGGGELSLQDFLSMRPYAGGDRVAVIGRADRLTEEAANCLLKTIEEPPPATHLILTTAFVERLPATIVSRCQTYVCAPVTAAVISDWLGTTHGISDGLASSAAALSSGRPGRALRLATEPGMLEAEVAAIDAFIAIAGTGTAGALRAAGVLAPAQGGEGRERALAQIAAWTSFTRDVACVANCAIELPVWRAYHTVIEHWARVLPAERVTGMLGRLVESTEQVTQYAVPRLTYEVLFLDLFATAPAPPAAVADPREAMPAGPAAAPERVAKPRQAVGKRRR